VRAELFNCFKCRKKRPDTVGKIGISPSVFFDRRLFTMPSTVKKLFGERVQGVVFFREIRHQPPPARKFPRGNSLCKEKGYTMTRTMPEVGRRIWFSCGMSIDLPTWSRSCHQAICISSKFRFRNCKPITGVICHEFSH